MAAKAGSTVFVGNIAFSITEEQLIKIFETVGPVIRFRLITDKDTGRSKGFGFFDFADADAADSAIREWYTTFNKTKLRLTFDQETSTATKSRDGSFELQRRVEVMVKTPKPLQMYNHNRRRLFHLCHLASTFLRTSNAATPSLKP